MNKILAHSMINCNEKITKEQVEVLQQFKDSPYEFDYTQADYLPLLNYNLDFFKPKEGTPVEKQAGAVEMSQQELAM